MFEYLQLAISPTVLPATLLLGIVMLYWFVALVAGLDFDFLDLDFDLGGEVGDASLGGLLGAGAVSLNFLNIGQLPINIWFSVFCLSFWVASMLWSSEPATNWELVVVVLRNAALALIPTKLITQPLRGKFEPREPDAAADLMGSVGIVTTAEVNPQSGQARIQAEGAPLLLNVKTSQSVIAKGEAIEIVGHDPAKNVYIVERIHTK